MISVGKVKVFDGSVELGVEVMEGALEWDVDGV